jgi:hypothetical protein
VGRGPAPGSPLQEGGGDSDDLAHVIAYYNQKVHELKQAEEKLKRLMPAWQTKE